MVRVEKQPTAGLKKPSTKPLALPSRSGSTQNMASNIRVVVRVRPPNEREMQQNSRMVIDVVDDRMLVFDPKEEELPFYHRGVQQPNRNFLKRPNKELKFVFDNVCNQDSTNHNVFEITTKEILSSLMDGYNCSVFVYGATGAGKTFTMIGNVECPGITYLTMEHLFYSINSFEKEREFEICVSYIEVYNENVYDLSKQSKVPLQLREDSKYGVTIAGLTLTTIKTAQELLNLLESGNKNRTQHPTDANAESSRSHAVFQVYINMRYKTSGQVRMVKLSMIDLAGSERASATGCVGERFKEGANINRSLLSLGNCINKLADGQKYIPYRDSKLTRLLKDSLGGNCKTIMIANISPSSLTYEDTYNTLKYAARANKIQHNVKKNIVDGDLRLSQYVKVIEELKKKVKELEAKLTLSSLPVVAKEPDLNKEKAKQEWRQRIQKEEAVHATLEQKLLDLMSRQRVLALRQQLKTRAFSHFVDLAHRSSTEAMEQMCTEEIPRQERAAENYLKQSVSLDKDIMCAWSKWNKSKENLENSYTQATLECPELVDFINVNKLNSSMRQMKTKENLMLKLNKLQNEEINAFSEYTCEMPSMLKKLYFTLKGYNVATPALTNEYLELMKKAKSAKGITWSDESGNDNSDPITAFIFNLDIEKPKSIPDIKLPTKVTNDNTTIDVLTTDEDSTDIENKDPLSSKKRKGTPIKLPNNETIIIDDSFENLDATRTLSAKKIKREFDMIAPDEENYVSVINPKDLNSTFVLAGKLEALNKLPLKTEAPLVKRGLTDRTNTMTKTITFNDRAKIVKPIVGKAVPLRRNPMLGSQVKGFGSSLSRDGTPLQRDKQAVRVRERVQTHPYSRPAMNRR